MRFRGTVRNPRMDFRQAVGGMFSNGASGASYLPNRLASVYQDIGAVSPSESGDGVSLALSGQGGILLGPELILNNDFTSGTDNWTASNSTLEVVDNQLRITSGSFGTAYQEVNVDTSKQYLIQGFIRKGSAFEALLRAGGLTDIKYRDAAFVLKGSIFTPSASTINVNIRVGDANTRTVVADYVTLREVIGVYASQSDPALSPLLEQNAAGDYYLAFDQVDDVLVATLPDLGTEATTIEGNASGVTITGGQTISGATNLPTPTELYGMIYVDRALSATEQGMLTLYMKMNGAG